jgi:hypothetical protein
MRYIAFSYTDGITTRDNNKMVRLIMSPAYQRLWGDRFKMPSWASGASRDRPQGEGQNGFQVACGVNFK